MTDIQKADGFLVTYAAAEQRSYELCDDLEHARSSYSEPPMGWTSLGISACRDGIPFCQIDTPIIQLVRPHSKVLA
jgi:hypothetical protein